MQDSFKRVSSSSHYLHSWGAHRENLTANGWSLRELFGGLATPDRCPHARTGRKGSPGCERLRMFLPMLDWAQCAAVERVPGKMSGSWVFKTTRVPVRAPIENLEGGATVNEFLTWFPGATREQVEAVLEHAERSLAVA
jgi:uncharacterized protein (DUF433 family)